MRHPSLKSLPSKTRPALQQKRQCKGQKTMPMQDGQRREVEVWSPAGRRQQERDVSLLKTFSGSWHLAQDIFIVEVWLLSGQGNCYIGLSDSV